MPPITNATVTHVAGAGAPDDWDRAAAAGAAKWSGNRRAYYVERVERRIDPQAGTATRVTVRSLYLDTASFDELSLDTDDVITFTLDGSATPITATAHAIARSNNASLSADTNTTRVELLEA